MERKETKKIVGTLSIDDAIKSFASISKENNELLERIEKINGIISEIIEERVILGLSQRDLAELTGIKQPMIARFEKSEMMPRIDTLFKIVSCLGLDLKVVHANDYYETQFDDTIGYSNKLRGDEIYGFTKSKECEYQA